MFMKPGQRLHLHAGITWGDLHYRLRGLLPHGGTSMWQAGSVFSATLLYEHGVRIPDIIPSILSLNPAHLTLCHVHQSDVLPSTLSLKLKPRSEPFPST